MPVFVRRHHRASRSFYARFGTMLLCALVVLAACGTSTDDGEEGHQFAGDGRSTSAPTATTEATTSAQTEPQPTAVPTREPSQVLEVRGAPQYLYLSIDGEVQVYDAASRSFTPISLDAGFSVIEYASSPTGDRVGILGMLNGQVVVQFFGTDGEPLGDPTALTVAFMPAQASPVASPVASPAATPAGDHVPVTLHITWVPQGNAVVVSGPGIMQRVSMSGTVMPISRTGVAGIVVKGLWSPMDSQVAILTQMMDGHQGVFMLDNGQANATELEMLHLDPGQHISNLQWLPSGLGLVFVAGNNNNGELINGQLYVYRFGDSVPTLIATSGQGGPAGTISHAVVSPDGSSVAYAIMVHDQSQWHLHSLWVRPVSGGSSTSIPLDSTAPVSGLFWTAEGLVWQQEDGSISVVDGDLTPRPLGEEPLATPVSSPQSTPVVEVTPRG